MIRMQRCATFVALMLASTATFGLAQDQQEDAKRYQEAFDRGLKELTARNYEPSIKAFEECIAIAPQLPTAYYNIACAYSLSGNVAKGNEYLEEALKRGFDDLDHIQADTDLDNIRNSEQFAKLIRKYFKGDTFEVVPAPSLTLKDLAGNEVSLSSQRGKVVILDFWATWCPPCRREIPHFIEIAKSEEFAGKVTVIGVSREAVPVQSAFATENGIPYTLLVQDGKLEGLFDDIQAIPTTFVIDAEGNVVRKFVGYQEKAVFEQVLRELLGLPNKIEEGSEEFFK